MLCDGVADWSLVPTSIKTHIFYFVTAKDRKETKEPQKCHFFRCPDPLLRSKHVRSVRLKISSLLWRGSSAHFSMEPLASTDYQVLLGRLLFNSSCWWSSSCYRYQVPPRCPAKRTKHGVWETTGRWDTWGLEPSLVDILSCFPSSTVLAGQTKQSPHHVLRLVLLRKGKSEVWCFIQQLPPQCLRYVLKMLDHGQKHKESQPRFLPTILWLKHSFLLKYTHTHKKKKQIQSKQTAIIVFLAKPTWCFANVS